MATIVIVNDIGIEYFSVVFPAFKPAVFWPLSTCIPHLGSRFTYDDLMYRSTFVTPNSESMTLFTDVSNEVSGVLFLRAILLFL